MAKDVDVFQKLIRLGVLAALGADDRHGVARITKRARLLPDAAIERHRQVLNDDENTRLLFQGNELHKHAGARPAFHYAFEASCPLLADCRLQQ